MCTLCYVPGTAIGEVALFGAPAAAVVIERVRRALGREVPDPSDDEAPDDATTAAPAG